MTPKPNRITLLCRVALAIATRRGTEVRDALDACADSSSVTDEEVEESILQGIPYSGFPGAGEALGIWREQHGPARRERPDTPERGPELFKRVYGDLAGRVREELARRHTKLEEWILDFAYGRVMGRGILELADLEALGVASLLGQERRSPLHSHLRGALRTGWSTEELDQLLVRLAPGASAEIITFARDTVARLAQDPDQ